MEEKKQTKKIKENKDIITKLWLHNKNNYLLKIPIKEIDETIVNLERTMVLKPQKKPRGYLLTNLR